MNLAETLNLMTNKDLTEVFNEICEEGAEVKKFKSKTVGIEKLTADFDEKSLMDHLSTRGISNPNDDDSDEESTEAEASTEPKRNRSALKNDSLLMVLRSDTKSRCALDILSAIDKLGDKATVAKVINAVCDTHVAPRSLASLDEDQKPAFVRGYVTNMIRTGFLEVVPVVEAE